MAPINHSTWLPVQHNKSGYTLRMKIIYKISITSLYHVKKAASSSQKKYTNANWWLLPVLLWVSFFLHKKAVVAAVEADNEEDKLQKNELWR